MKFEQFETLGVKNVAPEKNDKVINKKEIYPYPIHEEEIGYGGIPEMLKLQAL